MEINIKEDLSTTSSIPIKYLNKLERNLEYIIIDGIQDSLLENEPIAEFKSDIGSLLISVEGDLIRYKFVPSENFNEAVKTKIKYGQNLLKDKLDSVLISKITDLYKDLF